VPACGGALVSTTDGGAGDSDAGDGRADDDAGEEVEEIVRNGIREGVEGSGEDSVGEGVADSTVGGGGDVKAGRGKGAARGAALTVTDGTAAAEGAAVTLSAPPDASPGDCTGGRAGMGIGVGVRTETGAGLGVVAEGGVGMGVTMSVEEGSVVVVATVMGRLRAGRKLWLRVFTCGESSESAACAGKSDGNLARYRRQLATLTRFLRSVTSVGEKSTSCGTPRRAIASSTRLTDSSSTNAPRSDLLRH
jgi:hypothetical protein